jgi:outer membrane protein assembly factor BamB
MQKLLRAGLVGCTLLHSPLLADDWPRFRGPNGTGISEEKSIPTQWSADKNIAWKLPLPGNGNGSPIVVRGKVFLQAASDDQTKRHLICIDAKTGKEDWRRDFDGGRAKTHKLNSPASGTPASDGESIFCIVWDGSEIHLLAYSFTGDLRWKKPISKFASQHGPGHSPVVAGDLVLVHNNQDGFAELQAYSAKTGEIVWKAPRTAYRSCYSTPFLTSDGKSVIISSTAGLAEYELKTGKTNWEWAWSFDAKSPLRTVGSPVMSDGIIYAYSGDGGGDREMLALKPTGTGDISSLKPLWKKRKGTPYVPSIVTVGPYVFYALDKEGTAICIEGKSGKEIWSERLGAGGVTASLLANQGHIYIFCERGTCFVMKAGPTMEIVAKNVLPETIYATPAMADGAIFVRGDKHLYCIR